MFFCKNDYRTNHQKYVKICVDFWFCPKTSQLTPVIKNSPLSAGDTRVVVSIPELSRACGGGNGNPLHYSCLENSMGRGGWWATVHRVAKSQTWLSPNMQKYQITQQIYDTICSPTNKVWVLLLLSIFYKKQYQTYYFC